MQNAFCKSKSEAVPFDQMKSFSGKKSHNAEKKQNGTFSSVFFFIFKKLYPSGEFNPRTPALVLSSHWHSRASQVAGAS